MHTVKDTGISQKIIKLIVVIHPEQQQEKKLINYC